MAVEIEVTAIADLKESRLENADKIIEKTLAARKEANPEDTYVPNIAKFTTATELLDSGLVDAVIIATPHYDHCPLSIEAFKRNIHVMCEKPAGVYTKQVKEVIEAAKSTNSVWAMMFNQRTNCIYRKMREIVQSGELGEIQRVNWIITDWYRTQYYYDSGDWRATWSGEGGGVLLNQCPHQLDLWQWICGMPVKMRAKISYGRYHDIEVEDEVTATATYANGATGLFITTTGEGCGDNRFEIIFDGGKIIAEDGKLYMWKQENFTSKALVESKKAFDRIKCEKIEVETDGQNPQHVGVLNAFAGKILHGTDLVAGGEEGINGLTLSNAMHLSSFLGEKEIDIPFDDELYYEELMKRVKTSRRKENVVETVSDTEGSYGGAK